MRSSLCNPNGPTPLPEWVINNRQFRIQLVNCGLQQLSTGDLGAIPSNEAYTIKMFGTDPLQSETITGEVSRKSRAQYKQHNSMPPMQNSDLVEMMMEPK